MINLESIFNEEDLFPKTFTKYEETDFGLLFYNDKNKLSYDSNHALIYKNKIENLNDVLESITLFYKQKNTKPIIYESMNDTGYFLENKFIFEQHGYNVWSDGPYSLMLLQADNKIKLKNNLEIKLVTDWDQRIADDICVPSDETHEIEVIKQSIANKNHRVFLAFNGEKAVAITYFHISNLNCCRFDYIIVSKNERKNGFARELLSYVTDYCRKNRIENCFQWPAHKTSESICYEAGFRHVKSINPGRASYNN
ncbi:MAG: GNAT family N-acetyltransferase [Candidatus Delongbacteria bacterium]|nr:GNAT family N-acetyltransferase [Candidatus Delongbacteria bacterium]MBN2835640.1 GNAT family N-acetyltransferase [Candidatus Delongbacteria bacterium]